MGSSRTKRKELARETLSILERGWYVAPGGIRVSVREALGLAVEASVHYPPDGFDELIRLAVAFRGRAETEFRVGNETTFSAARRCLDQGASEVACLNFASAKNPGGGFLNGSLAQEEDLAKASGLYPCLTKWIGTYYEQNRRNPSCLYSDHMIYAPGVPVIRDASDALIAEPYLVSIVTSPAVNAGAIEERERAQVGAVMRQRARKVLAVLAANGHRNIVLGAWGCGVFRNPPPEVAGYFGEVLLGEGEFAGVFDRVVFGVLDRSVERRFIAPFEEIFGSAVDLS